MTIHEKILNVQCRLMQTNIPKTGKNKHIHYNYHELEDILPPVLKECMEEGLMFYFDFIEDKGLLTLHDVETKEEVVSHVRLLDLKEMSCNLKEISIYNIKNDLVHADNGIMTSAKRYLLLNMFLICEDSVIDLFDEETSDKRVDETPDKKIEEIRDKKVMNKPIPEPIIQGKKELEKLGIPYNRETIQKVIKIGKLPQPVKSETIQYIKGMC